MTAVTSFWHDCEADRNAGDRTLTLEGIVIPKMVLTLALGRAPFEPGSGKSDAPCERMHSENPSRDGLGLDPPEPATVLGVPADPQAAIATAQLTTASATEGPPRTCRGATDITRAVWPIRRTRPRPA